MVLSGGTAKFKNIETYLFNELGVACEVANPFKVMSIQKVPGLTTEDIEELAPMAMVVIGLALRDIS